MKHFAISFCLLAGVASGCSPSISSPRPSEANVKILREELSIGGGGEAAAGPAAPQGEPKGWAALKGVVKLAGGKAAAKQYPPTSITGSGVEICKPGGVDPPSELLVVGDDGGVANVGIYLVTPISDAEPWTHPQMKGKKEPVVFDQKACRFLTRLTVLQVSQPLLIKNSDPFGHNTKLSPSENVPFDQTIPSGSQQEYLFKKPEPAPFTASCAVHPWMGAYVLARPNGYFAVTGPDGSFSIANLPAGVPLTFAIWQEKAGGVKKADSGDAAVKIERGKFTVTLDPEKGKELNITLDADLFK